MARGSEQARTARRGGRSNALLVFLRAMRRSLLDLPSLALAPLRRAPGALDPAGRPGEPQPARGSHPLRGPRLARLEGMGKYTRRGQKRKAGLVWKIAREPRSIWLGAVHRAEPPRSRPAAASTRPRRWERCRSSWCCAREANRCSPTYQGGGPREDRATRNWYDALARESATTGWSSRSSPTRSARSTAWPAAAATTATGCSATASTRSRSSPTLTIYLEAGASDWESAGSTAKQLRTIGIAKVRGFMLNATHYDWTAANIRHGLEISRLTGGKHFIINTAENGRGPVHYRSWIDRSRHIWRTINIWCNPGLRGLGPPPTTETVQPAWWTPTSGSTGRASRSPARPQDRLVSAAGAHLRALRHQLGEAAARHALRALQALPAERVRDSVALSSRAGSAGERSSRRARALRRPAGRHGSALVTL